MRYLRFLPFFILSSLIVHAAEEMGQTYENSFTTISEKEFEEWSFQQAVQALGTPPGPVLESTYKMLRSSWNMKSYYKRNGRQHYLLNDITRNHTTTDMNTYMLVRADSVWMDHSCKFDSLALEEHMLKPYEEKEPRELDHQQKWLGMLAFRDDREWDYLLGITEGQRGIPPMLTQRRFTLSDGKEQRASEVNRLWTDPVLHAPYIMQRGSDFARLTLRCMLHDTSVLYDKAQFSGLTCWNYTWGKDLPEPLVLGMQLMQGRATGKLPAEADLQKIRDAERANVFKEYKSREGEIVSGSVKLVARKDVFVELGKTEAVMPAKECLPMEEYRVGDTVRAYVKRVQTESSGPAVVLSRADPEFVKALFRQEVAEVGDGSVEIVAIARDPGRRSKVAVRTLDPHSRLDPASACIGYQGSRVRAIVQELNNEKLDIVRYSDDPEIFVEEALKPAKISTIYVDDDEHKVYVTVPKDKLSLAIGRNGQNVRLASSLTGWRIEITADEDELGMEDLDQPISEEADSQSFENKRAELMNKLARDLDVEVEIADRLVQNGILSPEGVLAIEPALVKSFLNITDAQIQSIYEHAQAVVATKGV